jgi:leucyl aminopeptidase (aminopeptidase T)
MPNDNLDSLYTKVARKVLTETLQVKEGDSVTVETWDNGLHFARRALAEARAMGCTGVMIYEDEQAYVEGVRRGPRDVVGLMGKNEYGLLSGTDAYIFIPGQALGSISKTLKPDERDRSTRYNDSWYEAAQKAGLRGARLSFGYVGKDLSKALGKKVQDVVRGQLRAALVDFGQISRSAGGVSQLLVDGALAEVATEKSTLRFSLKGELEVEDGLVGEEDKRTGNNMAYMPPGFVSKEVDPDSANGSVVLTDTLTDYGVVPRVKLEFEGGKVMSWESANKVTMKKIFDSVLPEKRRLRFLIVGLNPEMKYGLGQDRFVGGAVNLGGFGFRGLVKRGTLKVAGTTVVAEGRLKA